MKVAEKSDKKENRVQPTNFKQDLNDSIEIQAEDSNSSIQVERLGTTEGM